MRKFWGRLSALWQIVIGVSTVVGAAVGIVTLLYFMGWISDDDPPSPPSPESQVEKEEVAEQEKEIPASGDCKAGMQVVVNESCRFVIDSQARGEFQVTSLGAYPPAQSGLQLEGVKVDWDDASVTFQAVKLGGTGRQVGEAWQIEVAGVWEDIHHGASFCRTGDELEPGQFCVESETRAQFRVYATDQLYDGDARTVPLLHGYGVLRHELEKVAADAGSPLLNDQTVVHGSFCAKRITATKRWRIEHVTACGGDVGTTGELGDCKAGMEVGVDESCRFVVDSQTGGDFQVTGLGAYPPTQSGLQQEGVKVDWDGTRTTFQAVKLGDAGGQERGAWRIEVAGKWEDIHHGASFCRIGDALEPGQFCVESETRAQFRVYATDQLYGGDARSVPFLGGYGVLFYRPEEIASDPNSPRLDDRVVTHGSFRAERIMHTKNWVVVGAEGSGR